ncbi:PoNe immunity protein domain-containing protein [Ralstonia holmesii]|uniref:PoNe immunity protein domain-containing protein n=1 Tax=Ralstonia holmesii TaxID=3058602 RepID=UPI003F146C5E
MARHNTPSFLPEPEDLHTKRRQKFLYDALYRNVHARLQEGIDVCIKGVRRGDLDPYYLVDAQGAVFKEKFYLWMLEYTAGKDIDTLAGQFASIVDEFVRWNELNVPYRLFLKEKFKEQGDTDLTVCAVDFDNIVEYEKALQLISIAILIRDGRSTKRIIAAMASNRHRDALYEQLILDYVNDPQEDIEEVLFEEPYATLVEAYFQESRDAAIPQVQSYLKQWYRYQDGARWYDAHKKIQEDEAFYYGYWAFEAAATCFLLGLDDSTIDHMVYPKDLVAYGRKLREEDRVTSDFDIPLGLDGYALSHLRCEAGQTCPQAGWWLTPAKTNSRRHFKQGEVMPAVASDYGSTIWQWDIDQSDTKL